MTGAGLSLSFLLDDRTLSGEGVTAICINFTLTSERLIHFTLTSERLRRGSIIHRRLPRELAGGNTKCHGRVTAKSQDAC